MLTNVTSTSETSANGLNAAPLSHSQHTIAQSVSCMGIGLHTGASVTMHFRPAPIGVGIRFVRTDGQFADRFIDAHVRNVVATTLGTVLANAAGASVSTVEHVLSACYGLGIDNLIIELDGPEAPIMDGSSGEFVRMLTQAGIKVQKASRRFIEILAPIEVRHDGKLARLEPVAGTPRFDLDIEIAFADGAIGRQTGRMTVTSDSYVRDLALARTFGFAAEVEMLRDRGLARGGSMQNAVVIGDDGVLNPEGLRFHDEFVRHKMLDAIGDLALAGAPILGRYVGIKPGHAMNVAIVQALLNDTACWQWRTLPSTVDAVPTKLARAV